MRAVSVATLGLLFVLAAVAAAGPAHDVTRALRGAQKLHGGAARAAALPGKHLKHRLRALEGFRAAARMVTMGQLHRKVTGKEAKGAHANKHAMAAQQACDESAYATAMQGVLQACPYVAGGGTDPAQICADGNCAPTMIAALEAHPTCGEGNGAQLAATFRSLCGSGSGPAPPPPAGTPSSGGSGTPAPTCNSAAYADAIPRVTAACPSLAGLMSGTTSLVDFAPGFCGSDCYNSLATELPVHAVCLGADAGFLLDMVNTCQQRPQCYSEAVVRPYASVTEGQCGVQLHALLSVDNFTAAAVADAQAACSGTCVTQFTSLVSAHPECMMSSEDPGAARASAMARAAAHMCTTQSGGSDVCGVTLKAVGRMECDSEDPVSRASPSCNCTGSGSSMDCNPIFSQSALDAMCGSCASGILPLMNAFGEEASDYATGMQVMCSTKSGGPASATNPYCMPSVVSATAGMDSTSDAMPSGATFCTGDAAVCLPKVISIVATQEKLSAAAGFKRCLSAASTSTGRSTCKSRFEAALLVAHQTKSLGALFCAQNRADTPVWCLDQFQPFVTAMFSAGSTCPTSPTAGAMLTTSGCCTPYLSDAITSVMLSFMHSLEAGILPSGTQTVQYRTHSGMQSYSFSFSARLTLSPSQLHRGNHILAPVVQCAGNTSENWALVESRCPPRLATRPAARMPVTLAWERVNADPALKARVEASLQADVAVAASVPPENIVNGQLVQGSGTVQLRSSSSRRQASTGSNSEYTFEIDGQSEAEATAAATTFEEKKTAGTLVTVSTAATVEQECRECMDARSSSLVNAAAPAPTPVPTQGAQVSAAGAPAAFVAAVFALLALVL